MNVTTTTFKGVQSFQFIGCQSNAFTVNFHRSLMCGHSVLPHGKSSPLQRNSHTRECQISKVVDDAIKGKNRKLLAKPEMCPPEVYEIMLKCWAHNTIQRATFEELFQMLSSIHK